MTHRDAVDQAEKILAARKIPLMADAWVELRNDIAEAILEAYRAGRQERLEGSGSTAGPG